MRDPLKFYDLPTLTQVVKDEAHRLGFQLVGVTPPDPPPHFAEFEKWLAAGRHGEMSYLASERSRQRRSDPRQILPECRSILMLGMRYPASVFSAATRQGTYTGKIASYAWGQDYHQVLPSRMEALMKSIQTQIGRAVPYRWYTDTGPILERDLAQRAGLGWIGKNTCLIHPRMGSYFFLAEILLGIELEFDPPFQADHCGNCTRCLDACPTRCILPDRTLDARRCLSYLTIEQKGPLPFEMRPRLGEWVFGCDICQQVCPWNIRFAASRAEAVFEALPERPQPDLIAALRLDSMAFNQLFRSSPIKRTKRRGYLRNVAVALGNQAAGSGDEVAARALAQALLSDPEPLVRSHAAWALGQVGGSISLQVLQQAQVAETDLTVLSEIHAAIQQLMVR